MKKIILSLFILFLLPSHALAAEKIWQIQSVDTMKYSRDASRDPAVKKIIPIHVKQVADLGANYVAIDTPYDDEFIPIMKLWVEEARKNNMNVWFRGNFSGWEGWFDYPKLKSYQEHNQKTKRFITENPDLFVDGDIFTPAPEPENGILGDPRRTGKKEEFNRFLNESFQNCDESFKQINRKVNCGVWSMNTDVLRETVSPETIQNMGGVISIDHYVKDSERMNTDIKNLAKQFNAKVVLGEFGAPIPDINGTMSEEQQAKFMEDLFNVFYENHDHVIGMNYWVIQGGSTTLYNPGNKPRAAVASIQKYFMPKTIGGKVKDTIGNPIEDVTITFHNTTVKTDELGDFELSVPNTDIQVEITASKSGYVSKAATVSNEDVTIVLEPVKESIGYMIIRIVKDLVTRD